MKVLQMALDLIREISSGSHSVVAVHTLDDHLRI